MLVIVANDAQRIVPQAVADHVKIRPVRQGAEKRKGVGGQFRSRDRGREQGYLQLVMGAEVGLDEVAYPDGGQRPALRVEQGRQPFLGQQVGRLLPIDRAVHAQHDAVIDMIGRGEFFVRDHDAAVQRKALKQEVFGLHDRPFEQGGRRMGAPPGGRRAASAGASGRRPAIHAGEVVLRIEPHDVGPPAPAQRPGVSLDLYGRRTRYAWATARRRTALQLLSGHAVSEHLMDFRGRAAHGRRAPGCRAREVGAAASSGGVRGAASTACGELVARRRPCAYGQLLS